LIDLVEADSLGSSVHLTELARKRQQLSDIFNAREVDNDSIDLPEFKRLCAVETKIAKASFKTRADKIAGNKILMEDKPSRWDDFQENLFLQMQQFE
jgi:hypothetical protein